MRRVDLCAVACFCLTACSGRIVDLDHTPSTTAVWHAPAAVSQQGFTSVWVDQRRLYWLTGLSSIQSCLKADCVHTPLIYSPNHEPVTDVIAAIAGNHVYWTSMGPTIFSCTTDDCQAGPVPITQDPGLSGPLFANGDYVYWSSDFDIYRCRASGCAGPPEVFVTSAFAKAMVFDETRAYWTDTVRIMRAPLYPEAAQIAVEPPTTVFEPSSGDTAISSLALGGGNLYWSAHGQIFRCPAAGCGAFRTTILSTKNELITNIKLERSTLYWVEGEQIRSCALPYCSQPIVITPPKVASVEYLRESARFAVDADDVYWLEARASADASPISPALAGQAIRRSAR